MSSLSSTILNESFIFFVGSFIVKLFLFICSLNKSIVSEVIEIPSKTLLSIRNLVICFKLRDVNYI
jgi:hypothetical protein